MKTTSTKFIVLEGPEGSGKSTQTRLLGDWLTKKGYSTLITKEPGADEYTCKGIRELILHGSNLDPHTEFLLFMADRAEHIDKIILPAFAEKKIVVCDRFEASTFAYQYYARKVCNYEFFKTFNSFTTQGLKPDFTIWIDVDPETGLQRNKDIRKIDRMEKEDIAFHRRVREGYRTYFEECSDYAGPYIKVAANGSIDNIHREIVNAVKRLISTSK